MNKQARKIQKIYLTLLLPHTLATSLIWGINTLFLLDAGLSMTEAFAANAFFTAGMVLFEIPTGVIADTRGRRTSYLLGTITLSVSTFLYLIMWKFSAPFWAWALTSAFLGLGFTFFSGADEAWLVDALAASGYFKEGGTLETVLAKGKIVEGVAMLLGSVAGGVIAQLSNLGVPYLLRAIALSLNFVLAFALMRDIGFAPRQGRRAIQEIKRILKGSIRHGLANPPVRWVMLASLFADGAGIYGFYAMQPYLLQLYGREHAYSVAGLAAAIVAGAQVVGGFLVPQIRSIFRKRTSALIAGAFLSAAALLMIGLLPKFWIVIALLIFWGLIFSAVMPLRQAYLNALIPSEHRATVLSFDSLMSSSGSVLSQPILGKTADIWGYPASYVSSALVQALAIPFLWGAKRTRARADTAQQ